MDKKINQLLSAMTLEEKVGQLFVLAFAGQDKDYAVELVRKYNIGGFYITDDNASTVEEAQSLAQTLQHNAQCRSCDAPLLLAVDQEGAWGILTRYLDVGPGNLALGKANDVELTSEVYQMLARQISAVGYNCILGPCADVNTNPDNPIIGQRSFGEVPDQVAQHVKAATESLLKNNMACSAKHFPGHGDTGEDSHQTLPVVNKDRETLLKEDLVPFKASIDAGVPLIMTSHIRFPKLDADNPATLSKVILQDLLQDELGFNGVIITDSMNMWAMRKHYDPVEAAVRAIEAGAHLVMLSEEHYENSVTDYKVLQQQTINGLIDAVKQGKLSEAIIDERLSRSLFMRYQQLPQFTSDNETVTRQAETAFKAARTAVQVLSDTNQLLPIKEPCAFVSLADAHNYEKLVNSRGIGPNDPRDGANELFQSLQTQGLHLYRASVEELLEPNALVDRAQTKTILLVIEDYPLPGEDFDPGQLAKVDQLLTSFKDRVLLVSLGPDYQVSAYKDSVSVVCSYSSRPVAAHALAEILTTNK